MNIDIKNCVGKYILIRTETGIVERYVESIAPSGMFVKISDGRGGRSYWRSVNFMNELIIEVL
jgi:hypothetical protein